MMQWLTDVSNLIIAISIATPILGGATAFCWHAWRKLSRIYSELVPNGGNSLRDVVDRLEQKHRSLVALSETAMFESDKYGRCGWANRAYLRLVDRSTEDVIGNGWLNTIHPEDQDRVYEVWSACVAQNRDFTMEYRLICSEGVVTRVLCQTARMLAKDGTLLGYTGSLMVLHNKTANAAT